MKKRTNKWFENAKKNLLSNSYEKEDFYKAKTEWYFNEIVIDNNDEVEINEERPSCELCEHEDLRWQFIIKNKQNENALKVGSTCIKQFDIVLIDKTGYSNIGEERDKKIDKTIRDKIKDALFNNALEALRKLWRKDKGNREIIEKAAKQWKEKNAFSPKMLFFLLCRFENNKIDFSKLSLKLNVRSDINKNQIEEMEEWKYLKIKPYLSDKQRNQYDSYFGINK